MEALWRFSKTKRAWPPKAKRWISHVSGPARIEPIAETLRLEDLFIRPSSGWQGKVIRLVQFRAYRRARQIWVQQANAQQTKMLGAMTDLARHAFELEHGGPPATLEQLVPEYLAKVPSAPGTAPASTEKQLR